MSINGRKSPCPREPPVALFTTLLASAPATDRSMHRYSKDGLEPCPRWSQTCQCSAWWHATVGNKPKLSCQFLPKSLTQLCEWNLKTFPAGFLHISLRLFHISRLETPSLVSIHRRPQLHPCAGKRQPMLQASREIKALSHPPSHWGDGFKASLPVWTFPCSNPKSTRDHNSQMLHVWNIYLHLS